MISREVRPSNRANRQALELFAGLGNRYDALAEVLSLGQNAAWRRALVSQVALTRPHRILDVATGTAGVAIALARATQANVVGVDLSPQMLATGAERVARSGLGDRIVLGAARAESLPFDDASFDAVTFTYLLRYVEDVPATLAELVRVLKPGGTMASLDFFVPPGAGWRLAWRGFTRTALPAAGLALGGRPWWRVGRFLGPNIESHYREWTLHRIVNAWLGAGMLSVTVSQMSLGGGVVMWGTRRRE